MKHGIITIAATVIALSLPMTASAGEHAVTSSAVPAEKSPGQLPMEAMPCLMMGTMQKNMGDMMGDMNSMMQMMSDPAMKERMQKMHENMAAMMQMMMAPPQSDKKKDAPTAGENDPHHPNKQ